MFDCKARELTVEKKKVRARSAPFGTKIVFHSGASLNQFVQLKFLHIMDLNALTLLY